MLKRQTKYDAFGSCLYLLCLKTTTIEPLYKLLFYLWQTAFTRGDEKFILIVEPVIQFVTHKLPIDLSMSVNPGTKVLYNKVGSRSLYVGIWSTVHFPPKGDNGVRYITS